MLINLKSPYYLPHIKTSPPTTYHHHQSKNRNTKIPNLPSPLGIFSILSPKKNAKSFYLLMFISNFLFGCDEISEENYMLEMEIHQFSVNLAL